jgi:hypothetical protein
MRGTAEQTMTDVFQRIAVVDGLDADDNETTTETPAEILRGKFAYGNVGDSDTTRESDDLVSSKPWAVVEHGTIWSSRDRIVHLRRDEVDLDPPLTFSIKGQPMVERSGVVLELSRFATS